MSHASMAYLLFLGLVESTSRAIAYEIIKGKKTGSTVRSWRRSPHYDPECYAVHGAFGIRTSMSVIAMTEGRTHYQHLNRVTARNEAVFFSVSDCPKSKSRGMVSYNNKWYNKLVLCALALD